MPTGLLGQEGLCQMQKERTFALAGPGDGQQIVAEHVDGERDRQGMPRMGRTADPPAGAGRQFSWHQESACASPVQQWKIGQVARLWPSPEHPYIGHTPDIA